MSAIIGCGYFAAGLGVALVLAYCGVLERDDDEARGVLGSFVVVLWPAALLALAVAALFYGVSRLLGYASERGRR